MHSHESPSSQRSGWFQSRLIVWVFLGFLVVGGFFLLTEHTAHVLGLLPFAIFLVCPIMMFFMMRGMHGGHDMHNKENQPPEGGHHESL